MALAFFFFFSPSVPCGQFSYSAEIVFPSHDFSSQFPTFVAPVLLEPPWNPIFVFPTIFSRSFFTIPLRIFSHPRWCFCSLDRSVERMSFVFQFYWLKNPHLPLSVQVSTLFGCVPSCGELLKRLQFVGWRSNLCLFSSFSGVLALRLFRAACF